jgi:hypothetical protein
MSGACGGRLYRGKRRVVAMVVLHLRVLCKKSLHWLVDIASSPADRDAHHCTQAGLCLVIILFFIPETHKPVILAHKVERKQRETGDKRYFAVIQKPEVTLVRCGKEILAKPFVVLVQEPMLLAIGMYMAVSAFAGWGCMHALKFGSPSLCMGAYISSLRRTRSCSRSGIR